MELERNIVCANAQLGARLRLVVLGLVWTCDLFDMPIVNLTKRGITREQHERIVRMVTRHWRNRYEQLETRMRQAQQANSWQTSRQMAARLAVSVRTIAYWTSSGVLPSYKKGRLVRYDTTECLQALRAYRRKSQLEDSDELG